MLDYCGTTPDATFILPSNGIKQGSESQLFERERVLRLPLFMGSVGKYDRTIKLVSGKESRFMPDHNAAQHTAQPVPEIPQQYDHPLA